MTDAERALANDPEGFARLRAVLHGPAGLPHDRHLPTRDERFGIPAVSEPMTARPLSASRCGAVACPGRERR